MNKKFLWVIAALVIAVGIYAMVGPSGGPTGAPENAGPEIAMPHVAEDGVFFFMKVQNPELIASQMISAADILGSLENEAGMPEFLRRYGANDFSAARTLLSHLSGFVGGADEMALLVASSDEVGAYLSYFTSDENFDAFLADLEAQGVSAEKWEPEGAPQGADARVLNLPVRIAGYGKTLPAYLVKLPGEDKNLVALSSSRSGVSAMLKARESASARYVVRRETIGPDYIAFRTNHVPAADGSIRDMNAKGEISWLVAPDRTRIQVFSDMFKAGSDRLSKGMFSAADLPLLGDGDLAALVAADIPFLCYSLFPTEPDPAAAVIDLFDEVPEELTRDVKAILDQGRISGVVVMNEASDEPNTAYVLLESGAHAQLDKLYSMAAFFLSPATLAGWDSAYQASLSPKMNIVAAHKKGALLVGLGTIADYGKRANLSGDIAEAVAAKSLANIVLDPEILKANSGFVKRLAQESASRQGVPKALVDGISFDRLRSLHMRQLSPERSELDFFWKPQP